MTTRALPLTDSLFDYIKEVSVHEEDFLRQLRAETAPHPGAGMQIAPDQGRFLRWLVGLLGARRCVEVGVFTGYSSTCTALALPPDGRLIACDVSEEYTSVARRYWARAGVESKIDLRLAPAAETLDALCRSEPGTFDFAFIDADKENYPSYFEQCLTLLRVGGVMVFDNALWGGSVANAQDDRETTVAIRRVNETVSNDARVSACLVTIGDGLLLARKL